VSSFLSSLLVVSANLQAWEGDYVQSPNNFFSARLSFGIIDLLSCVVAAGQLGVPNINYGGAYYTLTESIYRNRLL